MNTDEHVKTEEQIPEKTKAMENTKAAEGTNAMEGANAAENTSKKAEEKPPKSSRREIIETVIYFAVVIGVCFLFIRFVAYRCVVSGDSMKDRFIDGDNLLVEKVSYYFRDPERFEVVIFKKEGMSNHGLKDGDDLIKRVIGLPGETVTIEDGRVYINGELLKEDIYARNGYTSASITVTLGPDEFYVLGDNRDISMDSRTFGPIKKSAIDGRAWVRFWPLNKIAAVKNIQ